MATTAKASSLGLAAVSDVHRYVITDRPWLAADHTLGPWPDPADGGVFQTGAWILPDERPHLFEEVFEVGDRFIAHARNTLADGQAFQNRADLVELSDFVGIERGHECAPMRHDGNQTLRGELANRLAHGHPAHLQRFCQPVLMQALTGSKPTVEDHLPNLTRRCRPNRNR